MMVIIHYINFIFLSLMETTRSNIMNKYSNEKEEGCKVFCGGPLLEAVQSARLFHDSKTFVDMPLIYDPDTTLKHFEALPNKSDTEALRNFVEEHFTEAGTELEVCEPDDFVEKPPNLLSIQDPVYRQWAHEVHSKWKSLCRKVKKEVHEMPWRYSLIPLPYPFIVPGGRFRELYYWDSFWIIKGLLASNMPNFAKNMIRNLGEMVRRYGFVPNGGRIYYIHRTQPPVLPMCVDAYFKVTGDSEFLEEMLPLLEIEREFWLSVIQERSVPWSVGERGTFQFLQYRVEIDSPRPESYIEDYETAHLYGGESKQIYSDIAAGCESGWDFSSRWMQHSGHNTHTLQGLRTSRIIPIDLNAFACGNEKLMSSMYQVIGNYSQAKYHQSEHLFYKFALHEAFWDEEYGSWFDLDMDLQDVSREYYISNPTPLYTGCSHDSPHTAKSVLQYLIVNGATNMPGGIPTSFHRTGQQWDSPNGWAPNNHMIIDGLRRSAPLDPHVQEAAFHMADRWVQTNFLVYLRSGGKMFEKYDVESEIAHAGGGGEYEVQDGFGWTNGIILDLLLMYADRLKAPKVTVKKGPGVKYY